MGRRNPAPQSGPFRSRDLLSLDKCYYFSKVEDLHPQQASREERDPVSLEAIRKRVRIPATLMVIMAASCITLALTGLAISFLSSYPGFVNKLPVLLQKQLTTGGIFWNGLSLIGNSIILIGGMKMRKCQSYGIALTASVLCILCDSGYVCIGLIIGIWSILALVDKPEVKIAFDTAAQKK